MSRWTKAPRRDVSEKGIVLALTALGCSVQPLSGKGVPDLLIGIRGMNILLECKAPGGPKGGTSGRNLTPDQEKWFASWHGPPPVVCRDAASAVAAVMKLAGIKGTLRPVASAWADAWEPIETFPGQDPEAGGFTK